MIPPGTRHPEYESPPHRWPFPVLGRPFFLLTGLLLLALILYPFWGSIAVAAVFAFGLQGITGHISQALGRRRRLTSFFFVILFSICLFLPVSIFGYRVYEMIASPKDQVFAGLFSPEVLTRMGVALDRIERTAVMFGLSSRMFESVGQVQDVLRDGAAAAVRQIVTAISAAVVSLPELVLSLIVFVLFLYIFLAYPRQIKRFTFRLKLFRSADLKRSIQIFKVSSYNSLVANFLVGLLQASIITAGAGAVGFGEPVLIFSIVFILSYIPFIGAAPVGYLLAIFSFLADGWGMAIVMAGVATFAGLIDNVVRPYLVSRGGIEVHPVLSFASILGAIGIFGLKGIFLGPVILTATVALLGRTQSFRPAPRKAGILRRLQMRAGKYDSNSRSA